MHAISRRKIIRSATALLTGTLAFGATSMAQEQKEPYAIGFAVPVLANPFWRANADFAQKVADDLGVKLIIADADSQEDKQIKMVEDLISQGVKGLILSPVTQSVGPALLRKAEEAGIKVTFAERNPGIKPDEYNGNAYVGFVGSDNKAGGYLAAKSLYDAGVRNVIAMTGAQGNSVAELRLDGLKQLADEKKDLKILQTEYGQELREDGLSTTENFLSAHPGPGFDGIWAFNDETALGAIAALKQAGVIEKVKVSGLDATPAGVAALKAGEATISPGGHYIDGGFALIMLFDALNGHMPKSRWIEMSFLDVTSANADAYAKQFVDSVPPYDIKQMSVTFNPSASTDDYKIQLK